jgi:hypothetical protein
LQFTYRGLQEGVAAGAEILNGGPHQDIRLDAGADELFAIRVAVVFRADAAKTAAGQRKYVRLPRAATYWLADDLPRLIASKTTAKCPTHITAAAPVLANVDTVRTDGWKRSVKMHPVQKICESGI